MEVPKWSRWTIRAAMVALLFVYLIELWTFQSTPCSTVECQLHKLRVVVQHFTDSLQLQDHNHDLLISDLKMEIKVMGEHLRKSVEFFPLKDMKVDPRREPDRTWFMSTLRGNSQNGYPENFYFPSEVSNGRILCINGTHDISATYGFAWPGHLPMNSTLLPGLTFISDSYWDYNNPWHSVTSMFCHEAWRMENQCRAAERFVLYKQAHLVMEMGSWVSNVMEAALGRKVNPDVLDYGGGVVCFEEAVVYRKNLGLMSLENRLEMFDMIRCKARKLCNIGKLQRVVNGVRTVNLTLLARTGARSFKNESLMVSLLARECSKVVGCNFRVFHSTNLSFCEQVEALSTTDILVTIHGAQLTNLMFMSRGSSVMEIFPKGWLETAGVGQYVFHWLASWAGMVHEGVYRDTEGPQCPNPNDPNKCFEFYKDKQVGFNQTYIAQWTANVLAMFKNRTSSMQELHPSMCKCD